MARTGENIYCRRDGHWEGKYMKERINGKIRYGYVSGKSYEEVLMKKQAAYRAWNRSQAPLAEEMENSRFSILAEEWLNKQNSVLKATSINKYRNILNLYLIPKFGREHVMDISREEVSAYVAWLRTSGGMNGSGLSPKYITDILSVFKEVLRYASDEKQLKTANLHGITVKKSRKPLRVLSIFEQRTLESYLMRNMDLCGLGILLCLYTGIRLGELCALKWSDISFQDKTLHIHSTMTRVQTPGEKGKKTKIIVSLPKSDCSIRYIPIPDELFAMLRRVKYDPECYFLKDIPGKFVEPRTMENRFKAVLKACGIMDTNFHTLRHTFATRCIELGFDVKTLSEILGHASVKITMDRYVHPSMETKQKNMDKLSGMLSGRMG